MKTEIKKTLTWAAGIILLMQLLDTTILYACLVPIAKDFKVNPSNLTLAITSYIAGNCILVPIVNWLLDKYACFKIIITTMLLFALSSLLCGLSPGLYIFSLFRFFQGMAISVCSSAMVITLLSFYRQNEEIVRGMSAINIPALFGTAIGPFVGAFFAYYASWRYAFLINFPICAAMGIVLSVKAKDYPELFRKKDELSNSLKKKFDWIGLLLTSSGLMMISVGFEQLSHFASLVNVLLIALGVIATVIYVLNWHLKQQQTIFSDAKNFILDLGVFKNGDFFSGTIINAVSRFAMAGLPILMSILLQDLYNLTVINAGMYFAVIAIAGIAAKFLSRFVIKFGIRKSVAISGVLTAVTIISMLPLNFLVSANLLWIVCFAFGFTTSLHYTCINSVLYITTVKEKMANASNIGMIIQRFSIGAGVVIAVGGMQFLLNRQAIKLTLMNKIQIIGLYDAMCIFLFVLMLAGLTLFVFSNPAALNFIKQNFKNKRQRFFNF